MHIAILRGGTIRKRESDKTAQTISRELLGKGHTIYDVEINHKGQWYDKGILSSPYRVLPLVDVVIDTLFTNHSHKHLEHKFELPQAFTSEPHIDTVRKVLQQIEVNVPNHRTIRHGSDALPAAVKDVWRSLHMPVMVKSATHTGPTLISSHVDDVCCHIEDLHKRGCDVVVDTFMQGRVYSVVAIKNFRGQKIYTTTIVETLKRPYGKEFVRAGSLQEQQKESIRKTLQKVHLSLDLQLARYDFILKGSTPVLVNISTKPNYHPDSLLHTVFAMNGITFAEYAESLGK